VSKENTLDKFFEGEAKRVKDERKKQLKQKGYAEFYTPEVGETHMTVKYAMPRIVNGKYGSRKVFRIIVNKQEFDFGLSESSPLYRYFVRSLANAKGDVNVVLVRAGTGKSTKYDVKEA